MLAGGVLLLAAGAVLLVRHRQRKSRECSYAAGKSSPAGKSCLTSCDHASSASNAADGSQVQAGGCTPATQAARERQVMAQQAAAGQTPKAAAGGQFSALQVFLMGGTPAPASIAGRSVAELSSNGVQGLGASGGPTGASMLHMVTTASPMLPTINLNVSVHAHSAGHCPCIRVLPLRACFWLLFPLCMAIQAVAMH